MLARLLLLLVLAGLSAPVAWAGAPLDVNTATAAELVSLPGIGETKAQAIVDYRSHHGPFRSVDELDDVPGIGSATLANLRGLVTVDASVAAPAPSPLPAEPKDMHPEAAATETLQIDVNSASVADLEQLPGIGPSRARAIVDDRAVNGRFASCGELVRVAGVGPATVAELGDRCVAR